MTTNRNHLIEMATTAIKELAEIVNNSVTHTEDEYPDSQIAKDIEKVADDRLKGWLGCIVEEEEE